MTETRLYGNIRTLLDFSSAISAASFSLSSLRDSSYSASSSFCFSALARCLSCQGHKDVKVKVCNFCQGHRDQGLEFKVSLIPVAKNNTRAFKKVYQHNLQSIWSIPYLIFSRNYFSHLIPFDRNINVSKTASSAST